ncbi:GNAT family N-acetyltransferase [Pseudonocardia sp. CA-107938]|uniref:GNAT family N-acetyltransferase n=1 Tax=Pseudonocardia sp. CA-107938 TaxID=3240021 RepID=UPI003D922C7E
MDTLDTERLHLRRMTDDDADHLVALHNDPEVMRHLSADLTETRERVLTELLPYYRSFHDTPFGYWAAVERSSGRWLGWFLFRPRRTDPVPGEIELGYRLTRAAWGKGYATEGSRALVARGFADHDVQVVFAETMTVNRGSRGVMEKVGLRLVETWRDPASVGLAGAEHGDVRYALTREEWAASAHA